MKTLRLVLRDRVSAGAIAVLVGAMLFMQGLLGGVAQGTMASAAADPFNILCVSHDGSLEQRLPGDAPGTAHHDLCATLCQLAAGATPALPGGSAEIAYAAASDTAEAYFAAKRVPRAVLRSFFAEARAPPLFSA
ncbi:hypothetical protein ADU59_03530 [Pararhizobium polonicum]|uniref:DUF2946 domain-containing protein n=1 Tax=Pararhizobium polonicum TaxID=1612624 RepID=A0A1C7P675_9HYPH|nr:DUF2946 family protein [Pararhizobium polonicum]OBZ96815.1 hypothetical protein ADU59_03530 [Pararhizobium polonicum]